jgi:hypothetical protein
MNLSEAQEINTELLFLSLNYVLKMKRYDSHANFIILTLRDKEYKLLKSTLCNFYPFPLLYFEDRTEIGVFEKKAVKIFKIKTDELMRTIEEYHNIYVTVLHTFHIILLM